MIDLSFIVKTRYFLVILVVSLSGCAASNLAKFEERWVNDDVADSQREFAFSKCRIYARNEENKYLASRPLRNQNTTGGAFHNLARQIGGSKHRSDAFESCMYKQGFELKNICVSKCLTEAKYTQYSSCAVLANLIGDEEAYKSNLVEVVRYLKRGELNVKNYARELKGISESLSDKYSTEKLQSVFDSRCERESNGRT